MIKDAMANVACNREFQSSLQRYSFSTRLRKNAFFVAPSAFSYRHKVLQTCFQVLRIVPILVLGSTRDNPVYHSLSRPRDDRKKMQILQPKMACNGRPTYQERYLATYHGQEC